MKFSLPMAMFLVMFTLKLLGVITFSWRWVTAPLWIGLLIVNELLAVIGVIAMYEEMQEKKRQGRK